MCKYPINTSSRDTHRIDLYANHNCGVFKTIPSTGLGAKPYPLPSLRGAISYSMGFRTFLNDRAVGLVSTRKIQLVLNHALPRRGFTRTLLSCNVPNRPHFLAAFFLVLSPIIFHISLRQLTCFHLNFGYLPLPAFPRTARF